MRGTNFATILVVLAQAWAYGCSSAETPAGDDTATGGTGGATGGTGGSTGGTGGSTGGTGGSTGGTGGSTGGTGGSTGGTGAVVPPECKGIKTGMACTPEGQACPNLVCGLGDSGTRSCNCATNWSCTPCDWTNSQFAWAKSKPADIQPCTGTEADEVACPRLDATCEGAGGGTEACVCFLDDEGMQIWDCDKPPGTWAASAN
jgi:hypothetical protein